MKKNFEHNGEKYIAEWSEEGDAATTVTIVGESGAFSRVFYPIKLNPNNVERSLDLAIESFKKGKAKVQ